MAKTRKSLAVNALSVITSGFVIQIINFLFHAIAARILGVEKFGLYNYGATLVTVASAISDLGLSLYITKTVAQDSGLGFTFAARVLLLKFLATLGTFILVGCWLWLRKTDDAILKFLGLMGLAALVANPLTLAIAWLRGLERMTVEGLIRVAWTAIPALLGATLLVMHKGVMAIALGQLLGCCVVTAVAVALWRPWSRADSRRESGRGVSIKAVMRGAWPFALLTILVTVSYRIDMILLEYFRGANEVGIYAAAYRLFEMGILIRGVLPAVLLPVFSRWFGQSDRTEVARMMTLPLKYHVIAGVLAAITLSIGAPWIIRLVYGTSAYDGSVGPLRLLSAASLAVWISALTSVVISASPNPQINVRIAFIMVVVNVGLNVFALPRWGAQGAAATTVITEFLGVLLNTLYIRKSLFPISYGPPLWLGIACGASGTLLFWVFPSLWVCLASLFAFLCLLFSTRSLSLHELRQLVGRLMGRETASATGHTASADSDPT